MIEKYYCDEVEPGEGGDTPPIEPVESEEEKVEETAGVLPEDDELEEIEDEEVKEEETREEVV